MDELVAVMRYDHDRDNRHCLSLLPRRKTQASAHLNLPFDNSNIYGMRCRGKLYFYDGVGNSVIYDLTTGEKRTLSPPVLDHATDIIIYHGCGMGYDAVNDDYKVIRNFSITYDASTSSESDCFIGSCFIGSAKCTQLYSFNSDTWKPIPSTDAFMDSDSTVYIEDTGCCNWLAILGEDSGGIPDEFVDGCISFNFTKEEYGYCHLPTNNMRNPRITLVTFGDSLGVIFSPRPYYGSFSGAAQTFLIYSWEDDGWERYYEISVDPSVQRPLAVIHGQFMFVELKLSQVKSQLAVYDLLSLELKRFDIFSFPKKLDVFSIGDIGKGAIQIFRD